MVNSHTKETIHVDFPKAVQSAIEGETVLQRSGLRFTRNITLQQWEDLGRRLLAVSDSSAWWIADWLVYGETSFQERYTEAIRQTSLNYQTLRNYAWVARRFDLSRRRDNLSFGHHAEVAALAEPEQDYWLRKAERLRWSRNQLRREVRASLLERQAITQAPGSDDPRRRQRHEHLGQQRRPSNGTVQALNLRVTANQLEQFAAAARDWNLSVDDWAIQMLDAAARQADSFAHG